MHRKGILDSYAAVSICIKLCLLHLTTNDDSPFHKHTASISESTEVQELHSQFLMKSGGLLAVLLARRSAGIYSSVNSKKGESSIHQQRRTHLLLPDLTFCSHSHCLQRARCSYLNKHGDRSEERGKTANDMAAETTNLLS